MILKRVATRPDCASILCTEFPGADLGLPRGIAIFWLALPFGRSASPWYFQSCARLVAKLHRAYQPVSPMVGVVPFVSHMFAGDAMIVEVDLPQRLEQAANAWGHCCGAGIGNGSVSEKEKRVGGEWAEEAILLGCHVNVQTKRVRLPGANIEGARLTETKPVFNAGNTAILL